MCVAIMKTVQLICNSIAGNNRTIKILEKINNWAKTQQDFVLQTFNWILKTYNKNS